MCLELADLLLVLAQQEVALGQLAAGGIEFLAEALLRPLRLVPRGDGGLRLDTRLRLRFLALAGEPLGLGDFFLRSFALRLRVSELLAQLEIAARGKDNLIPLFIECVENNITLGEICNLLRGLWGEYQPPVWA